MKRLWSWIQFSIPFIILVVVFPVVFFSISYFGKGYVFWDSLASFISRFIFSHSEIGIELIGYTISGLGIAFAICNQFENAIRQFDDELFKIDFIKKFNSNYKFTLENLKQELLKTEDSDKAEVDKYLQNLSKEGCLNLEDCDSSPFITQEIIEYFPEKLKPNTALYASSLKRNLLDTYKKLNKTLYVYFFHLGLVIAGFIILLPLLDTFTIFDYKTYSESQSFEVVNFFMHFSFWANIYCLIIGFRLSRQLKEGGKLYMHQFNRFREEIISLLCENYSSMTKEIDI